MSDSSVLTRHLERASEQRRAGDAGVDCDECDDLGAFGWLRGIRDRAIMLELRKKDGRILAVGYAWLDWVELDPSAGITLHAGDTKVCIAGRNLNGTRDTSFRLYEGITRHRVAWIREAVRADLLGPENEACLVESIEWEVRGGS
jgi:hypothetical protein